MNLKYWAITDLNMLKHCCRQPQITDLTGTFVCLAILMTFSDGRHHCFIFIFFTYYQDDMISKVLILLNTLLGVKMGSRQSFNIMKYIDGG